jgi:heme/copper-type cytochrome/quinol oxidase subunit 2
MQPRGPRSLIAFVILVAVSLSGAAQEPAQNRRDFTIVASNHTFSPDRLEVTQDDLVKITVRANERPTSFAIDAYRIVKRIAGGTSVTFEFRAAQAGTFPFYCNLTKDAGCKDMRGTLVVRAK